MLQYNTADGFLGSLLNEVYDLSKLIKDNYCEESWQLIKAADTNITHWFDPSTQEVILLFKNHDDILEDCSEEKKNVILCRYSKLNDQ